MASITLTISNNKIAEFKAGYFAKHPVPLDANDQPLCTDLEHFKNCLKASAIKDYKKGKKLLAERSAEIDETIIT
tara:strand:+ start:215 stop:439 length:225 start_codon:yes stop_codon:yes gene_type:complete